MSFPSWVSESGQAWCGPHRHLLYFWLKQDLLDTLIVGQLDSIKQGNKGRPIYSSSSGFSRRSGLWFFIQSLLLYFHITRFKGLSEATTKPVPTLAININSLLQSFHFPSCCSRKTWIKKPGAAQGQLIALRWQKIIEQLTKWPWEGTGPRLKVTVGSVCPVQPSLYAWRMKRFSSPRIMQLKSTPPEPTPCQLVQNRASDPGAELKFEASTSRIGREGEVGGWSAPLCRQVPVSWTEDICSSPMIRNDYKT